ncbi:MAG: lipopolysaccharide assembly protein LapA domain-containing protein [Pseudomonadota bacterium]|nr:lipopolysaccharide assembly protein LapA domain-containing protein [Reyranella sp.]
MKILSRALFLLFVLAGVLIAVSNTQPVQLAMWPLPHIVVLPLYLLVVGLLLTGILAGLGIGWWAARHHRRRVREASSQAARLEREVARLRDVAGQQSPMTAANVASPGQKAIERQRALVAPDLASPATRGPLS